MGVNPLPHPCVSEEQLCWEVQAHTQEGQYRTASSKLVGPGALASSANLSSTWLSGTVGSSRFGVSEPMDHQGLGAQLFLLVGGAVTSVP